MSQLIEIKFLDPVRERGIVATCDIETGATIMTVRPDISVMYTPHNTTRCHDCFEALDSEHVAARLCPGCKQFLLCQRCQAANYASEAAAAETHALACEWFQQLPVSAKDGDTDYVRFMLEYCARVQGADTRLMLAVNDLCSNEKSQSDEVKNFCSGFSKLLANHFGPRGLALDQHHVYLTLLRIKSNCLGFPFSDTETLGWAVQEELCMLNHSCVPNAAIAGDANGNMLLKTVRPIAEGDEICISYIHVPDFPDVDARRRHLLDSYRFLCKCPRCEAEKGAKK